MIRFVLVLTLMFVGTSTTYAQTWRDGLTVTPVMDNAITSPRIAGLAVGNVDRMNGWLGRSIFLEILPNAQETKKHRMDIFDHSVTLHKNIISFGGGIDLTLPRLTRLPIVPFVSANMGFGLKTRAGGVSKKCDGNGNCETFTVNHGFMPLPHASLSVGIRRSIGSRSEIVTTYDMFNSFGRRFRAGTTWWFK